jgi:hypothetical protein
MKLTPEEYELLHEVAIEHAVALGTLARILTVKGARATAGGLIIPPRNA